MIRMEEMRSRRGLTLVQLEELTGIDSSTLSRYENGKQDPSVTRGLKVARALGVSVEDLVGGVHGEQSTTPRGAQALAKTETEAPAASSARESAAGAR